MLELCSLYIVFFVTWDTDGISGREGFGEGVNGFKVTALSQNQVCRKRNCRRKDVAATMYGIRGAEKTEEARLEVLLRLGLGTRRRMGRISSLVPSLSAPQIFIAYSMKKAIKI